MENISDNNKLIAQFLGFKITERVNVSENYKGEKYPYSVLEFIDDIREQSNLQPNSIENMHFHTSWDWLMPVVEKIESVEIEGKQWSVVTGEDDGDVTWHFQVEIYSQQCLINRCAIDGDESDFLNLYDCRNFNSLSKIEVTYKAVVEFIKWYNQQQK